MGFELKEFKKRKKKIKGTQIHILHMWYHCLKIKRNILIQTMYFDTKDFLNIFLNTRDLWMKTVSMYFDVDLPPQKIY